MCELRASCMTILVKEKKNEFHLYAVFNMSVCVVCIRSRCGMLARYGRKKELRIVLRNKHKKMKNKKKSKIVYIADTTTERKTDPTTYQQEHNYYTDRPKHISEHKNCNLLYMTRFSCDDQAR